VRHPLDSAGQLPLKQRVAVPPADIGSPRAKTRTQTGLHSTLLIDDVACGPPSAQAPFAFKADYADPDGVAEVTYAILPARLLRQPDGRGEAEGRLDALQEREVLQPDFAKISDGFNHLVVRARDSRGLWSLPADLPFVCDRQPPKVTTRSRPSRNTTAAPCPWPSRPSSRRPSSTTNPGSPARNAAPLATDNGLLRHHPRAGGLRDRLDLAAPQTARHRQEGDVLPIPSTASQTPPENAVEPVKIDFPIDLAADKRRPPCSHPAKTDNVLWSDFTLTSLQPFSQSRKNLSAATVQLLRRAASSSLTPSGEGNARSSIPFSPPGTPTSIPFVAISFRTLEPLPGTAPSASPSTRGPAASRHQGRPHAGHHRHQPPRLRHGQRRRQARRVERPHHQRPRLLAHRDRREARTADLTYISFYFKKGVKLQLRSFSILAPWNSDH
jgi:hypothetical protein